MGEFRHEVGEGKTKMFEFSGLAVAGSRIYVVDNESDQLGTNATGITDQKKQAFFEVVLEKDGGIKLRRAFADAFAPHGKQANDIEALAMVGKDLYAVGSHSLKKGEEYKADRHFLMRVQGAAGESGQVKVEKVTNLSTALNELAGTAGLKATTARDKDEVSYPTLENLNIEGLSAAQGVEGLLIGLRSPQDSGQAIVLHLHNPSEVFAGAKPKLSLFKTLDLEGYGVSVLDYDEVTKSLLVGASGKEVAGQEQRTQLWQWKLPLKENVPVKVMSFDGHKLEGVCRIPAGLPHAGKLLLAFDEEDPDNAKIQFGRLVVLAWPE